MRTGRSAIEELRGKPTFEWLEEVPELAAVFNDAMTSISKMETPLVVAAYDFSRFGTIVDVGGGHGLLLSAILAKWPETRGILFDAESVVAGAPAVLELQGVSDRCTAVGGSFFESVPAGGDAYVLKHIIHDWDDEKSLQILRNVRAAMTADAKLLIIESVVRTTTVSTCRNCSTWKCWWPPRVRNARKRSTPTVDAGRASATHAPFDGRGRSSIVEAEAV